VLTDPRVSADVTRPGFPALTPLQRTATGDIPFVRTDPPEHTGYRRMLAGEFTRARAEAMRPTIEAVADSLLTDLLARPRPADLVEAFAVPLPALVTCRLLGLPQRDYRFFESRTRTLLRRTTTLADTEAAMGELHAYLDALVDRKLTSPADDLLSRLVTGPLSDGRITREQLLTTCLLLLNAAHETTSNMISLGTLALLSHPDQLAALREDRGLLPGAVEELLRYLTIADITATRIAIDDLEIARTRIRAGDGIIVLLGSADRDEQAYPQADRLDLRRSGPPHLAFGHGIHQCIGRHLARVELEVAFDALLTRAPELRVALPPDDLPYTLDGQVFGLAALPLLRQPLPAARRGARFR
jgi:cytochrome P450